MTELLSLLNHHNEKQDNNIHILYEPPDLTGITIKQHIRILYFGQNSKEKQYIGFEQYNIEQGKLYIVPPCELSYLPHTAAAFSSIDIPLQALSRRQMLILLAMVYTGSRVADLGIPQWQKLQNMPGSKMQGIIFGRLSRQNPIDTTVQAAYLNYAEALYRLIPGINFTHNTNTDFLAMQLGISPKTLLRACKAVFSIAPKYIIRYHLLSKCIYAAPLSQRADSNYCRKARI